MRGCKPPQRVTVKAGTGLRLLVQTGKGRPLREAVMETIWWVMTQRWVLGLPCFVGCGGLDIIVMVVLSFCLNGRFSLY